MTTSGANESYFTGYIYIELRHCVSDYINHQSLYQILWNSVYMQKFHGGR